VVSGGRGEERDVLSADLPRELLDARLIASLATLNNDGSIHVVAMWFLWDGAAILIPTNHGTRKARNLERDPRATVMIDDSRGGFDLRGITFVGRAEIVRGPVALELNRKIHLKYVTEEGLGLKPVHAYLATDDVTIRVRPERVSSWDLRLTEQCRALSENRLYHALA
jgi:PPOX class probable F420-dependent enzyme